ncbi:MAG: hypothetical protein ABIR29_04745 [Chthoniobacterales bacterium]
MKTISFLAVLIIGWYTYQWLDPTVAYPPGVLIASDPVQTEASPDEALIATGKFQLKALAHFSLDARVLHRKIYRYDQGADLVPVDLAVGWGPMSDQSVLDRLEISQASRFFYYEYRGVPPIAREEIVAHATNLHLIPSNPTIAGRCRSLRAGDLIHLSGLLVEASGPGIGTWRSSLTRTDSGNGACELVWVQEVTKIAR